MCVVVVVYIGSTNFVHKRSSEQLLEVLILYRFESHKINIQHRLISLQSLIHILQQLKSFPAQRHSIATFNNIGSYTSTFVLHSNIHFSFTTIMGNDMCGGTRGGEESSTAAKKIRSSQVRKLFSEIKTEPSTAAWLTASTADVTAHLDEAEDFHESGNDNAAICRYQKVIDRVNTDLKTHDVQDTTSTTFRSLVKFKARSLANMGYVFESQIKMKIALVKYEQAYAAGVSMDNVPDITNSMFLGKVASNLSSVYVNLCMAGAWDNKEDALKWLVASEDWFNKCLMFPPSETEKITLDEQMKLLVNRKKTLESHQEK